MAFLFSWVLAVLAQLFFNPLVSAATTRIAFTPPAICFAYVSIAILLCVVSRHMFRWRRHRPRPKSRRSRTLATRIASSCSSATMLLLRTVTITWLLLVCSGICINFVASALDLRTPGMALHSDLNVATLRSAFASPASRQLPDLGLRTRVAAYAQHLFTAHFFVPPASTHIHSQHFHNFGRNASSSSSLSCTSPDFLFAYHLQSRQHWPAAAHRIVPAAHALHAPVHKRSFSSPSLHSTAHHLAVTPQGPQSALCAQPTYASAYVNLSTKLSSPSLAFYRLSSRGERLLASQRFGAAAGGAMQLVRRLALQLSSWGGGARITLAAACDRAGRLGAAAHQLWRQVRAHCTTTTDTCIHSLGATLLELGGGASLCRLVRCWRR
jgi:hypothetical protein